MAEGGPEAPDIPVPQTPQAQQQPTQQVQQLPHFKPDFSGNQKMQKLIYLGLITG